MQDLNLIEIRIEKITFDNNIIIPGATAPVSIETATSISSIVKYDDKNAKCKCATTVTILPKGIDVDFKVVLCVAGVFGYNNTDDKKEIHVAACKKLFPHVQSSVISFMTMVGFPNFIVEEPSVSIENVKQSEGENS